MQEQIQSRQRYEIGVSTADVTWTATEVIVQLRDKGELHLARRYDLIVDAKDRIVFKRNGVPTVGKITGVFTDQQILAAIEYIKNFQSS